jgi:hypothetical protein
MKDFAFVGMMVVVLICMMFAFCFGILLGHKEMRSEAIQNNLAEYVCNPTNGVTEFKWKNELTVTNPVKIVIPNETTNTITRNQ